MKEWSGVVAAVTDKNSYLLFHLFVKSENEQNAVHASLLVKFCLNIWFVVNFVGLQNSQAANTLSKFY